MAKLGVITDGISRDLERALEVMKEAELEYAELQYLWDKEVGDHDAEMPEARRRWLPTRTRSEARRTRPCRAAPEPPA